MSLTSIAIHGAAGRMGRRIIALGCQDPQLKIVGAIDLPMHPDLGKDAGLLAGGKELGLPLSSSLASLKPDVVIDFSVPAGADAVTAHCVSRRIPLVMATTGLSEEQKQRLHEAGRQIPVVWSPSMSMTVNLAMKLVERAGAILKEVPGGVDVEIIERHHRTKEDAPSGTALKLGAIIAEAMGQTAHRHGREGMVGKRPSSEIGYHAVRVGDNPGEHTIIFGLLGETLEITVKASSRDCYALGALAAAKFVATREAGMYSMYDVLGL
jgi:4-hydroxy-tetrahydrodipicolinate reductase